MDYEMLYCTINCILSQILHASPNVAGEPSVLMDMSDIISPQKMIDEAKSDEQPKPDLSFLTARLKLLSELFSIQANSTRTLDS